MSKLSDQLKAFLFDWIQWVDRGAPEGMPFDRSDSLCMAAYDYMGGKYVSSLQQEMEKLFVEEGLNWNVPFNEDGLDLLKELRKKTAYLNQDRVAWVRRHVAI